MAKATDTVRDAGASVIRVVTGDIKEVSIIRDTRRLFRRPDATARQTQ
jgi:hypothetical protein